MYFTFDKRDNISEIQEELSSDSSFELPKRMKSSGLFGGFLKDIY